MFAEKISGHPKLVIMLVILSLVVSGYYASQAKIGVSTGNFQLKNSAYKTYNKILKTFGSETDDVIIVSVSKDGYIFNRGDMEHILKLEMAIDKNVSVVSNESLVDYVLAGIHFINILHGLPDNLNISISPGVFEDTAKIENAISNYHYVQRHGNDTIKNDSYNIYVLLPEYAGMLSSENGSSGTLFNFTYPSLIHNATNRTTVYNATTMLIDEIEIYQNLSSAGVQVPGAPVHVPSRYNVSFLNNSLKEVDFNITRASIAMEHYNGTYLEWYAYNASFNLGLSLLYSGYRSVALGVYNFERTAMLNASAGYASDEENWTSYRALLGDFYNGTESAETVLNATVVMENRTFGTLRDFLKDYSDSLEDYINGSLSRADVLGDTVEVQNISTLMRGYANYSLSMDAAALPVLNRTISEVENNSGYSGAVMLTSIAKHNVKDVMDRVVYYYGEKMILEKLKDILTNLRSILLGDEPDSIKQDAWELLYFGGGLGNSSMPVQPFYRALNSYRDTVYSDYFSNTTGMLWDYMTLKPFDFNYSYNNINVSYSYSRESMLASLKNMSQKQIDTGLREIHSFNNESVERLVTNYTTELSQVREDVLNLSSSAYFIKSSYSGLGSVSDNLTLMLENFTVEASNATLFLNKSINRTYSMRQIEDFFSLRHMYFNTLLSRNALSTILILGVSNSSYEMPIYNISKSMSANPYVAYHTLSSKVLVREIEVASTYDMKTLLPVSILLLVALLFLTYRSLKAVLISLSAVLIAITWLFAFTAIVGWDFDPILLAVPILMVGIGIDDGIYVTLRYMEERRHRDRIRATQVTVASVGGALVLTTLTSMVGFMSNSISSMEDIQRFGILAAVGLVFSFVAMNTFLPAVNMLVDTRGKIKEVTFKPARVGAEVAIKAPFAVMLVVLLLAGAGIYSFWHLNTEFTIRDLAPANSEIVRYYHYYEQNFNASVEYSYIYMEGNLTNPAVLKAMAQVQKNVENDTTVVHDYPVLSPWSIMKSCADARPGEYLYNASFIKLFHESDTNHDGFPDRNISMLYSMLGPKLKPVLRGNQAIFIIRTNSDDLKKVDVLVRELNEDAQPLRKYVKVEIAGDAIVGKASLDEINENQIRSLFLSITAAITMLVALFMYTKRSFTLGIIAAVPIMVVVTWNWLLMYILGISLNVMTNTIASLCVGLGVDYGIHITHRFVEESQNYYDLKTALFRSTERMGRGLVGAAATTIAAIGVLTFSTIPPLSSFALILSFSILFAFISAIFFLPSLLIIWAKYRRAHGYDAVAEQVIRARETGNPEVLCRYHLSRKACVEYVHYLISAGRIAEARELVGKLKEEGLDLTALLRGSDEIHPPFE